MRVHVYERQEASPMGGTVTIRRGIPGRLELRRVRPGVWQVRERPPPVQRPLPRGRPPRGKLNTDCPQVKARLPSRATHDTGYRPSFLTEVRQGDALPLGVKADAVMAYLTPPDPPGPLVGLAEILAPLGAGKWSGDGHRSHADPVASGDEGPADVGEALRAGTGTDSTGTTPDPLRPAAGRSGTCTSTVTGSACSPASLRSTRRAGSVARRSGGFSRQPSVTSPAKDVRSTPNRSAGTNRRSAYAGRVASRPRTSAAATAVSPLSGGPNRGSRALRHVSKSTIPGGTMCGDLVRRSLTR